MLHALAWFVVVSLIALWSLLAWAFHASAQWAAEQAGALASGGSLPQAMGLPPALEAWIPAEWVGLLQSLLAALGPSLDTLSSWLPSLASGLSTGLTVVVGLVWVLGLLCLLLLGAALSGAVALFKGRRAGAGSSRILPALPT